MLEKEKLGKTYTSSSRSAAAAINMLAHQTPTDKKLRESLLSLSSSPSSAHHHIAFKVYNTLLLNSSCVVDIKIGKNKNLLINPRYILHHYVFFFLLYSPVSGVHRQLVRSPAPLQRQVLPEALAIHLRQRRHH